MDIVVEIELLLLLVLDVFKIIRRSFRNPYAVKGIKFPTPFFFTFHMNHMPYPVQIRFFIFLKKKILKGLFLSVGTGRLTLTGKITDLKNTMILLSG